VTWNNKSTIADCLDSIKNQTQKELQIIIIDNHSEDGTIQIIKGHDDNRIQFIQLNHNIGFAGGHNLALKHALGDYVLFINPDIIMQPNYIENAIISFLQNPTIGCIAGLLKQVSDGNKTNIIDSAGLCFARDRRFYLRYYGKDCRSLRLDREEIFGCDGALPFYRFEMIQDLSIDGDFFDESFFAHKEDWDISWRARLLGWNTLFEPTCIAWHVRSFRPNDLKSRNKQNDATRVNAIKNQYYLMIKNEDISSFLLDFPLIILRQFAIFIFIILRDFKSVRAYFLIIKNLPALFRKRKEIKLRQKVTGRSLRKWIKNVSLP